jgi:hypothetical protein
MDAVATGQASKLCMSSHQPLEQQPVLARVLLRREETVTMIVYRVMYF